MPKFLRSTAALLLLCSLFSACKREQPTVSAPTVETQAAADATKIISTLMHPVRNFTRPSAALGLYASVFLSQHGAVRALAAVKGVEAQMKFHGKQHPVQNDETYALLSEYGNVLGEDIIDLLNRSDNRPDTLNTYVEALSNITVRAKKRTELLTETLERLRKEEKAANDTVNGMQKKISEALRNNDYATAGAEQQPLAEAQTALAALETERMQTQDVLETYEKLIGLAEKRLEAIEQNREILIAGLSVVDVPGIDELGLIETGNEREDSGGFQPFGGL